MNRTESMFAEEAWWKEVKASKREDWSPDPRKGLWCTGCGMQNPRRLLSNPKLPRVLCIECYVDITGGPRE